MCEDARTKRLLLVYLVVPFLRNLNHSTCEFLNTCRATSTSCRSESGLHVHGTLYQCEVCSYFQRSMKNELWVLVCLLERVTCNTRAHGMLAGELVSLPVEVKIGLLGFNGDGARQLELKEGELHSLLSNLLPERRPSCGTEALALDAVYRFRYKVVIMQTGITGLHHRLAQAMRRSEASEKDFEVEASEMEGHFEALLNSYFSVQAESDVSEQRPASYTILVVNPNRADIAALRKDLPLDFSYRYRYNGGAPTQQWLSASRYMVLDLSAGPVTLGRGQASEGTVSIASLPILRPQLQGGEQGRARREESATNKAAFDLHHTHFVAQLTTCLLSAVRSLIAPDASTCDLPHFEQLVVPIVVLVDHNRFDPLEPGHRHSIDLQQLRFVQSVGRLSPQGPRTNGSSASALAWRWQVIPCDALS